jgi:hypothetical protein
VEDKKNFLFSISFKEVCRLWLNLQYFVRVIFVSEIERACRSQAKVSSISL